ncbi:hypothetical protein ACFQ0M_48855 [Kitasatospora aburaviensis]
MRNILSRVPFAEHAEAAGLADPDTLRQWAATALFTADIPTADIATAPALQIRPWSARPCGR